MSANSWQLEQVYVFVRDHDTASLRKDGTSVIIGIWTKPVDGDWFIEEFPVKTMRQAREVLGY